MLNHRDTFFCRHTRVPWACFVDLPQRTLWCSNLGDSRAVVRGIWREDDDDDGILRVEALSVDHTAASLIERQRIQELHPHDDEVVVDMTQFYEDPPAATRTTTVSRSLPIGVSKSWRP